MVRRRGWGERYAELAAREDLTLDELEALAEAAYLTGSRDAALDAWTDAHRTALDAGEVRRALDHGFWLAFALLNHGELARGGGWVDRLHGLGLEDDRSAGQLRYLDGLRAVFTGDVEGAHAHFEAAQALGRESGDRQVCALAAVGRGRCAVFLGRLHEGLALLDEGMVAVSAQDVSPIAAGDVCCTVIEACNEVFDLRRVQEWTSTLSTWCDGQEGLVLYRGQCLLHRAELKQLQGDWDGAEAEADSACARLSDPPHQHAIGAAHYLRAELHRLRGELAAAEAAYAQAHSGGRDPQPGLALLRLAQGRPAAARASLSAALAGRDDLLSRCPLLPALVAVALALQDHAEARAAADELVRAAAELDAELLRAHADAALGAVALAEGDHDAAAGLLRKAVAGWQALGAAFEAARTRALLSRACAAVGDVDGALLEARSAREELARLGAADLALLDTEVKAGPLSDRELEVLRLVARGRSNKDVARELVIAEKTVARHLSNIFAKLGVGSRAAATAYAYEHALVEPAG